MTIPVLGEAVTPVKINPTALVVVHLLPDLGQADANLITFSAVPRTLRVVRNDIQTADTIDVTLDLEDFPIDPRIVKAITIEAFLADSGNATGRFWDDLGSDLVTLRKYAVFMGVIDEVKNTLAEDGRLLSLSGRDYSAYFLDIAFEAAEINYGSRTLVEIIQEIISARETTKAIQIELRGDGIEKLKPETYKIRANRPKPRNIQGKERDVSSRKRSDGVSAWEIIQELSLEGGIVAYIELDKLVLATPQTLNIDDPQSPREIRYTLGRDIHSNDSCRRLGRRAGIRVIVSSWDSEAGITRRAFSPNDLPSASLEQIPAESLGSPEGSAPTITTVHARPFVVRGIRDQAQLQRIADCIAEQLIHHGVDANVEAMRFVDSAGKSCLEFRYGDPVVIDIDPQMPSILAKSVEEQIATLLSLGYPVADAQALAQSVADLHVPYWLNAVTYDWSEDSGIRLMLGIRSRQSVRVSSG